jgi:hypothetical protein
VNVTGVISFALRRAHRVLMRLVTSLLALAVAGLAACGDGTKSITEPDSSGFGTLPASLASCGTGTALYSALPVAASNILGWVPLGAQNPTGHTFPTDHQYIYVKSFGQAGGAQPVEIFAPGNVTVVGARRTQYGAPAASEDYSIMFSACRETWVEFGHVKTITPSLLAKIPAFDQGCNTYSPSPGQSVTACWTKSADIKVNAGEVIGTTAGLDLTMFDSRVPAISYANNARWGGLSNGFDHFHVVPFSDYYSEPMHANVQGMLGSFDGKIRRTIAPLGGTIATDIAGTAQGTWFFASEPTYPEYPHLAINPDNVEPNLLNISMGTSGGQLGPGLRRMHPSSVGPFNRHPAQITPGSTVHCWDLSYQYDPGSPGIALIQLVDATTLKIEGRLGAQYTCANQQPSALTAAAVTFRR